MTRILSASAFSDWLTAYGAAWTEKDAEAMAALFTPGGRFQPGPFAPPVRGRDAIAPHWRDAFARQINPHFEFKVWIAFEATGLAHWRARLTRGPEYDMSEIDGVMRARFDLEGDAPLCKSLEVWTDQAVVASSP